MNDIKDKIFLYKHNENNMYRPIKGTNERFIINEKGIVLDTRPGYMEHMEWQWDFDPTQPREVTITEEYFCIVKDKGKYIMTNIHSILKQTFPELYQISEEKKQRIINSYLNENQKTYSISLDDFNKLIYPNKLIKLYETTAKGIKGRKWEKPTIIKPNENGMIVLKKGRKYFGLGTRNVIHFDENGLPFNAKSWAEPRSTTYSKLKEK